MATVRHLGLFSRAFALCPVEENATDFVYNDIHMPLSGVVAVYWRVKKWKFSFSAQWAEINANQATWELEKTIEFTVGEYVFDVENTIYRDGVAAENERELVCGMKEDIIKGASDEGIIEMPASGHFIYMFVSDIVLATGGTGAGEAGSAISFTLKMPYNGPASIYNEEQLFTPPIDLEFRTAQWIANTVEYNSTIGSYGSFNLKMLGKTYSCQIFGRNGRNGSFGFTNTLSINADLEPAEYWPYDPDDGLGPIYDKDTGAQLRAFPA
jgi:hypothetical protein